MPLLHPLVPPASVILPAVPLAQTASPTVTAALAFIATSLPGTAT